MKRSLHFRLFFLTGSLLGGLTAAAQPTRPAPPTTIERRADGSPELIRFERAAAPTVAAAPAAVRAAFGLSAQNALRPLGATETDDLGAAHRKYQQVYQGVPVEFTAVTVHSRAGAVEYVTGETRALSDNSLRVQPGLTAAAALPAALAFVGATEYQWQRPNEAAEARAAEGKATFRPVGELVIVDNVFGATVARRGRPVLAWKFNIYAAQPLSRAWVYVDAQTGEVVNQDVILKDATATATYTTRYSGTRQLKTEQFQTSPAKYRLHDYTRGSGVRTYNASRSNVLGTTDFTDANNTWTAAEYNNANQDWVAGDAHFGAQCTYDYWLTRHNRNSFDGAGALIKGYAHFDDTPGDGKGLNNAFWDGAVMKYGDGYQKYSPLTSLDVCGHELGHAICQYTANLKYENESGGLNEGFSDIWGACVEQYAASTYGLTGKNTWLIGEEIRLDAAALRSMSDPKAFNQPNTYQGINWVYPVAVPTGGASGNDYGGVHTNSGVLNYWFYLLSQGGSGTNDKGVSYNLVGLGMTCAAKIAYATEKLLTPTSGFVSARTMSLQAAQTLYGANSSQVRMVDNAWAAVGIGTGTAYGLHAYYYVDMVALNAMARTSGDDGGYFDGMGYTQTVPVINRCGQQTIVYSARYFGSAVTQYWNVYIDYNRDGDFGDAGERVVTNRPFTTDSWATSSFVVPATAALGDARMRVILSHVPTGNSVGTIGYGEVEDFRVTIAAATTVPVPTNLHATNIAATSATVNWNSAAGAVSYTIRYRQAGSLAWTTTTASAPYTGRVLSGLTSNKQYQYTLQAINGCGTTSAISAPATFTTLPSRSAARPDSTSAPVDSTGRPLGLSAAPPASPLTLTAYPNPATDALHLTLTTAQRTTLTIATVDVYDQRGARVQTVTFDAATGTLRLAALKPGLYTATVRGGERPASVRFLKE